MSPGLTAGAFACQDPVMRRMATAHVIKVVDADTFHAALDIGWGIMLRPRGGPDPGMGTVRILFPDESPYDAPEVSTPLGQAARDAARRLVPDGSVLEIISFKLDAFGRTLGAATLPDGRDWATTMTGLGYVKTISTSGGGKPSR